MTTLLFIIISAISKAISDKITFHYSKSIFKYFNNQQYFNPKYSWKNKYKNGNPILGERFFLSTTMFVFLTDFWHLIQFFYLTSMFLAIVLYKPIFDSVIIDFIVLRVAFGIVFNLFYNVLLTIKKQI